jgi:CheW-like domain
VDLRAVPHAPGYLAGLLRYRGGAVPVIDLGLLMGDSACEDRLDLELLGQLGDGLGLLGGLQGDLSLEGWGMFLADSSHALPSV